MARTPSSNPMRGRKTTMRGAGRKSFKVPTTKITEPPTAKAPKMGKMTAPTMGRKHPTGL
jgi:hypothetical protein